jgi:uncharacterized membrane protein
LGFIFFTPGYATLAALYPNPCDFSRGKRFFASFGMSVIVSGLISLIIAYVLGLNVNMAYGVPFSLTMVMLLFAGLRRSQLDGLEEFSQVGFQLAVSNREDASRGGLDKVLHLALGLTILLVLLAAGRLWWVTYHHQPAFSEFYILGTGGLLDEYPDTIASGEPLQVMAGVTSHNPDKISYRLYASVDEGEPLLLKQFILANEQHWQDEVSVPIDTDGHTAKVSFLLFAGDLIEPVGRLYLWLDPID